MTSPDSVEAPSRLSTYTTASRINWSSNSRQSGLQAPTAAPHTQTHRCNHIEECELIHAVLLFIILLCFCLPATWAPCLIHFPNKMGWVARVTVTIASASFTASSTVRQTFTGPATDRLKASAFSLVLPHTRTYGDTQHNQAPLGALLSQI